MQRNISPLPFQAICQLAIGQRIRGMIDHRRDGSDVSSRRAIARKSSVTKGMRDQFWKIES